MERGNGALNALLPSFASDVLRVGRATLKVMQALGVSIGLKTVCIVGGIDMFQQVRVRGEGGGKVGKYMLTLGSPHFALAEQVDVVRSSLWLLLLLLLLLLLHTSTV